MSEEALIDAIERMLLRQQRAQRAIDAALVLLQTTKQGSR